MYKKTLLVNQNGDEFIGWSDNEFNPTTGELIFNTAMTGFVEILSDPSYINQIITSHPRRRSAVAPRRAGLPRR